MMAVITTTLPASPSRRCCARLHPRASVPRRPRRDDSRRSHETLRDLADPIHILVLDGRKDLYAPFLELVEPHLASNALVIADLGKHHPDIQAYQRHAAASLVILSRKSPTPPSRPRRPGDRVASGECRSAARRRARPASREARRRGCDDRRCGDHRPQKHSRTSGHRLQAVVRFTRRRDTSAGTAASYSACRRPSLGDDSWASRSTPVRRKP